MDGVGLVIIGQVIGLLRVPLVLIKFSNFENRSPTHWAGIGRSSWQELTQMEHRGCPCSWGGTAPQSYVEIARNWLFRKKQNILKNKKSISIWRHLTCTHGRDQPIQPKVVASAARSTWSPGCLSWTCMLGRRRRYRTSGWQTWSDQSLNVVSEKVNINMI